MTRSAAWSQACKRPVEEVQEGPSPLLAAGGVFHAAYPAWTSGSAPISALVADSSTSPSS